MTSIVKSSRQVAVRKLDKVFSEYIRRRDCRGALPMAKFGRCCSCRQLISFANCDAGHFIGRRFMSTRWREDNVHGQCRSCNRFQEGNGVGYTLFMIDKYGREHVEYLQALSKETTKFTVSEIELIIKEYREKIKAL